MPISIEAQKWFSVSHSIFILEFICIIRTKFVKPERKIKYMNEIQFKERKFKGNNIIWILFLIIALYVVGASIFQEKFTTFLLTLRDWSSSMYFILGYYTAVLASIIFLAVVLLVIRKNHFIMRSFLPAGRKKEIQVKVIEDTYIASNNNTVKMLLIGLLLGFLTNFTCILCALAHGDIKLYFDFSANQIPVLLFALLSVFFQSTSEELWCRGYLYERLNIHYPLWVAIVVNGVFFGLLHIFNDGVSPMAIIGIIICGFSYSLVRWYTGSIWICMGIHTMWNFTQNFLFGLPNSGLVSEMSVFHLDAATGTSSLIYDYGFGVEAAIPALLVDAALGIGALLLAKRDGRLGELTMSYEKRAAAAQKNVSAEEKPAAADEKGVSEE